MFRAAFLPRTVAAFVAVWLAACSLASDEQWFGLYLRGTKIGYATTRSFDGGWSGAPGRRLESDNVIRSTVLGQSLELTVRSTTWTDAKGAPVRLEFTSASGGRTTRVVAKYGPDEIVATLDTGAGSQERRIPVPPGARLVEDATVAFLTGERLPPGRVETFYVLDPVTLGLMRTTARLEARQKVKVRGADFTADVLVVQDARATTRMFFSGKGDVIKVEGPLGIEMLPEPKEQARRLDANPPDIALSTTIRPDEPIADALARPALNLRITGVDLAALPSDAHQTVRRDGDGWRVSIHPIDPERVGSAPIEEAAKGMPEWLKEDLFIPPAETRIVALARETVGTETDAWRAARAIHRRVHGLMTTNAGIGVLRDATEVLATREGVCRDHAILMAALLRAANIPAKLVSGLVYADGQFFYHAWVEAWTGRQWAGLDSTRPGARLSATHIKIGQGRIDQAFAFPVFDGAKLEVLDDDP